MGLYLNLKKKMVIRRIIEGVVAVLSLALLLVFWGLREKTGTVQGSIIKHVVYSHDYDVALLVFGVLLAVSVTLLLCDFLGARVYYTKIDEDEIVIGGGVLPFRLYVNGLEEDILLFNGYMEATLSHGVKMVASPQFFRSFHLTFSNSRPPIDL